MLPTTQEYKISLMVGQDSFQTLEGVEVIPNPNYPDEPWYSTGGLAIVFKLKLKDKLYALKCFYTDANERKERLRLIAVYLKQNPSPYFVDFTYLEDELWVETDNDEGQGYPVVLMEWVEGKTLSNYLEQICTQNNTPALKNLYFQFCNLAWWLQQQPIAHGDIKHDNLIVTPDGKLKLIDYDCVFIPALRGRKANEMGSPCYQHPKRDAYFFDKNLDDFSLLVLQITLLALQHQPKLFNEHYNGDGIILKDTDYQNFAQSSIKTILWQLPEVKIPLLLSELQGNLNNLNAIDLMPLLQDVAWINWLVDGHKDSKLEFEKQRLKYYIINDKRWSQLFINRISLFYPFKEALIEKYKNNLNWSKLNRNPNILWTFDLIEKYKDKWHWGQFGLSQRSKLSLISDFIEKYIDKWNWGQFGLSSNPNVLWTNELIEKYEDKWDWETLSSNSTLPWTISLIDKYKDKWTWDKIQYNSILDSSDCLGLVTNSGLPWTPELIEKYKDKWNWEELSRSSFLPWTPKLIKEYKDKWNWKELSGNLILTWTDELVEKYKDMWNWKELSGSSVLPWTPDLIKKYKDKWNWEELSHNLILPWTDELIEKYQNEWSWKELSRSSVLPWTSELIKKYKDKWNWEELSHNLILPWTDELIEKYQNEWSWTGLSRNSFLPWTDELIEKYKNKWNWEALSCNSVLPWTLELIDEYKNNWNWKNLSYNSGLPWEYELIEKYKKKWDKEVITYNSALPWTMSLIEEFPNYREITKTKGIYEKVLISLLNDEFIEEVIEELQKKV